MTAYQIEQYKIRYKLDNFNCAICGKRATQIGHRLGNTTTNRKVYGNVIDHVNNIVSVCGLVCNKRVDIGVLNQQVINKLLPLLEGAALSSDEIDRIINTEKY